MSPNEVTEMWNCTFDFSLGLGKHTRRLKYTDFSLLWISFFLTSVSTIFSNCFTRFMLIFSIYFCSYLIPKPHLPILDECPSELPYSQTTAGATRPAMSALIPLLLVLPEIHHRGSQHVRQHCNNCQGKKVCLCLRKTSAISLFLQHIHCWKETTRAKVHSTVVPGSCVSPSVLYFH